jgi:hypothetical protein
MTKTVSRIFGIALALLSIFFIFYTGRLVYVTRGLSSIRRGGQGAYVGAIVFPLLAIMFGWAAWKLLHLKK